MRAADFSAYSRRAEGQLFLFFFISLLGSLGFWLSLPPAHTRISGVAVRETGISKSSSIFLWLLSVTKALNSHAQPVNSAAILTSGTPAQLCNVERKGKKSLCLIRDTGPHIYHLCNLTLLKSSRLIDFFPPEQSHSISVRPLSSPCRTQSKYSRCAELI